MSNVYDLVSALRVNGQSPSDFVRSLKDEEVYTLLYDYSVWRLPHQVAPVGDWRYWTLLGGRGAGKTQTGSWQVNEWARDKKSLGGGVILIAGRTHDEVVDSLVVGQSGVIASAHPKFRPHFFKGELRWPNGVRGVVASGDVPASFRRHNVAKGWLDELPFWQKPDECFSTAFDPSLRVGDNPQCIITTSPTVHPLIRMLRDKGRDPDSADYAFTTARMADNPNLNPKAQRILREIYEGTRIGLAELDGQIPEDETGALLSYDQIENHRLKTYHGSYDKVVVSVDPVGSDDQRPLIDDRNERRECGITVGGSYGTHMNVIADYSMPGKPPAWAARAVQAYRDHRANYILAEKNFGGDMVEAMIKSVDDTVPVVLINAHRGKRLRAEPVAGLYQQGRVHHLGVHGVLENQWTMWIPGMSKWSPDRLDACVHLVTDLLLPKEKATGSILVYRT